MAASKKNTKKPPVKSTIKATTKEVAAPFAIKKLNIRHVLLASILIVLLGAFLARGWIRTSVGASLFTYTHGKKVQNTLREEMERVEQPLISLGHRSVFDASNKCKLQYAQRLHTNYFCSYTQTASTEVPVLKADRDKLILAASGLQERLESQGWRNQLTNSTESVPLTTLLTDVFNGTEITPPNAQYLKDSNGTTCVFSTWVFSSESGNPRIDSDFTCFKDVRVFGGVSPDILFGPDHIDAILQ